MAQSHIEEMYKDRAMLFVTKKHKKAYKQSLLTKMKDKNTKKYHYHRTIVFSGFV